MQGHEKMGKKKIHNLVLGLLAVGALLVAVSWAAAAVGGRQDSRDRAGADLIVIDTLKSFGALERPAVPFYHDKHTKALVKDNQECTVCHLKDQERLSLKFKRLADSGKDTVMDIYHEGCISCHTSYRQTDKKSGPVTCGQCHLEDGVPPTIRQPISLDKSLHYRHVKASDKKCELCHHAYDAKEKKLFYDKGKEGACLYCHKEQTEENRISNRLASHQACISCHQEKAAKHKDAGPVQCAGCHDPAQQAMIERLAEVPRMERNQPDVVLVRTLREDEVPANPPDLMNRVPFDHKAHEGYNDTCKVCHHADMNTCVSCHTLAGHKDGQNVKLAQAMHQKDAEASCIGCHNLQKQQPQCAGCHHSIAESRTLTSETTCRICHIEQGSTVAAEMTDEQTRALAADLLVKRRPVQDTIAPDKIPEVVTIRKLSDQYEPVKLPHRKIVHTLARVNEESRLAAHFHQDPLTLCQGCHHNSPASLNPPRCASCHGQSSEALNLTRPGLLAAYHQQCIECHQEMGIAKPASRDCTACHAKRKS